MNTKEKTTLIIAAAATVLGLYFINQAQAGINEAVDDGAQSVGFIGLVVALAYVAASPIGL